MSSDQDSMTLQKKVFNLIRSISLRDTEWKLEGPKLVFFKRCASRIWGGSIRSDLKKLDAFTWETSTNHLIRNFLRNERVRVKTELIRIKKKLIRNNLVFSKRCASQIWASDCEGQCEGQWGPILKQTRLLHLGNVGKQPHPQFSAKRACEG